MTTQTHQDLPDPWNEPDGLTANPAPPALTIVPNPVEHADGEHPTWEYATVHGGTNAKDAESRLNAMGAEGWELVSVVPPHDPSGQTVLYMKRPRLG